MNRSLASLLTLLLVPVSAGAATRCVNPGGSGGCFASIQQAVDAAAAGDLIDVAAGTYVEGVGVPAHKRITIRGAGPSTTIVDGNGANAAIRFNGPNPGPSSVENIGLRNADFGLQVSGVVRLALSSCAISDNRGGIQAFGGAIVTMTDCSVTGNGPNFGGIDFAAKKMTIVSSRITGNTTTDFSGGGITSVSRLTVIDSTISDNVAGADGGGIQSRFGTVTIAGSTISGNSSAGNGGGILLGAVGKVSISNSTISGNSAGNGGGIDLDSHRAVTFDHVTIADNAATNQGGGINAHTVSLPKPTTIKASLIADNTAPVDPDCSADRVHAQAGNLVEDPTGCAITAVSGSPVISLDPLLGPLQNNGGQTETQALGVGSPAIGVVTFGAECRSADQRGVSRAVPCDLGSFEAP